jgi:diguanylate cyclase (GGDEF)-like protein/PAS domain S-box-containing protein
VTVVSERFLAHQGLPPLIRLAAEQAKNPLILITYQRDNGALKRVCAVLGRALPQARILALSPASESAPTNTDDQDGITITLIDQGPFALLHLPARGDLRAAPAIDALTSFVTHQQSNGGGTAFLVLSALPGAKTEAVLEGLRTRAGDPQVQLLSCGTDGVITVDGSTARGGFAVVAFANSLHVPMATPFGGAGQSNAPTASGHAVFYRTIVEELADGVCLLDPTGIVLYENVSGHLSGSAEQGGILGQNLTTLFDDEHDRERLQEAFRTLIGQPGGQTSLETVINQGTAQEKHLQLVLRNCIQSPHIRALVCSLKDITALKEVESQLRRLVSTDALTGVASRRHLLDKAHSEMARAHRHNRPLSLLLIDLDHFKRVNDQLGHASGDAVLRSVGAACRNVLRREETVGRLGGEEFAVLLPETNQDAALLVAERLRRAFTAAAPPEVLAHLPVTASIGIAQYDPSLDTTETWIARADSALYDAKRAGRNRCAMASVSTVRMVEEA